MAAVDVIIPLFNKPATIERALRSVQAQTFADWRLLVVDDGSTDASPELVRRMQTQDGRIVLIVQANQGPGAARNAGIRAATASYVAFLDADDQWYPWHLENLMAAAQQHDAALFGSTYYEWPTQRDMRKAWAQKGIAGGLYRIAANESPEMLESFVVLFHVDTTLVKTDVARKYGGFHEGGCRHGEDLIFFSKVMLNEPFVLLLDKPSAVYHRQASELTAGYDFKLNPMLLEQRILLDCCPAEKHPLAEKMLARLALRTAFQKARNGRKAEAIQLMAIHPAMREFKQPFFQLRVAIALSPVYPYWVKTKCFVGPPARRIIQKLLWKLGIGSQPPAMG